MIVDFSPWTALCGGALIGAAAVLLMRANGRIMGIAGIVDGVLRQPAGKDAAWRLSFLAGMVVPGMVAALAGGLSPGRLPGWPVLLAGGFLVGLGTRMGNGCTSGHGICGLGRFSPRSAAAVAVFMASCAATVFVTRHLLGGG